MKKIFLLLGLMLAVPASAAQHDYNIANSSGAVVRGDINDALSAIATNNSGTSAPSTTFAYQWWADTTNGLLKIRNSANSAWVTVGTLASANLGLINSVDTLVRDGGTVGGTADAITLTPSPAITAYAALQGFRFVATGTNTTTVTVNVSSLGTKTVKNASGQDLLAGQLVSGRLYNIIYDGTYFIASEIGKRLDAVTASKTTTYSIALTDDVVLLDGSSAAFTATLPTAVGIKGREFIVKRTDQTLANLITIATTSSQTFDGSGTTRKLATQGESYTFVSDGSNWVIKNHYVSGVCTSYSPTLTAFGTSPTVNYAYWCRRGRYLFADMAITAGTSIPSSETRIALPSGLTTPSSLPTLSHAGTFARQASSSNHGGFILKEASKTYVTATTSVIIGGGSGNGLSKANGVDAWDPSGLATILFQVPIDGWED